MKPAAQSGVALVSILVVVAIAVVLAVSMIRQQQSALEATRGFLTRGQAMQYALGGEEIGRQLLFEDYTEQPAIDHLDEPWASSELSFEYEQGEVLVTVTDLQGLFNLNTLAPENPDSELTRQRLVSLVATLGQDQTVVTRVLDWLDADISTRPGGAEDYEYLGNDPPYRAGNALMAHVSELRLLGLAPQAYDQLRAFVTALPEPGTPLNVNTAPAEVLQSLSPQMTYEAALALTGRSREQEGYESVQQFLQAPELAGLGISGEGLGVQSSFFEIRTIARYRDRFSYLTSVVYRNPADGSMRVIQRDFSRNIRPVVSEDDDRG